MHSLKNEGLIPYKKYRFIVFIDFPAASRGVQAQTSRVVIQPGFVTYQGENSFNWVPSCLGFLPYRTKTWLNPQGLCFDIPDLNLYLYCLDPRGSPQRASPGGCGWGEDAPILSVRGHGQHSITHGESQSPRSNPPEPDGLPVSTHAGLWKFTCERTFIAGQACASLCFVEL